MKRFIILVMIVGVLISNTVYAKASRQYKSMSFTISRNGHWYLADCYWRGERIARYRFSRRPKIRFIKHDNLTYEMLSSRKNTIYVEIMTGTQLNEKDGKIDTIDDYYNYISYNGCGFKPGDKIRTYCIFNPYTQWEDDVTERYDELMSTE